MNGTVVASQASSFPPVGVGEGAGGIGNVGLWRWEQFGPWQGVGFGKECEKTVSVDGSEKVAVFCLASRSSRYR